VDTFAMRHRITLQSPSAELDATGQPASWNDVATVWAAVEPLRGREYFAAQQVNAETTTRIRIRYRAGVTSAMRGRYGSRTYDIVSVIDVDERHVELQLMCTERKGGGAGG